MNNTAEINASFKQANVKGGVAVLTFEILTEDVAAFDIIRMSGKTVVPGVTDTQPQIVFVNADGEVE